MRRVPEKLQLKVLREVAVLLSAIKTIAAAPSLELKVSWQHWLIPSAPCSFPTLQLTNLIWEIPFRGSVHNVLSMFCFSASRLNTNKFQAIFFGFLIY